jgi:hypothetical protein
MSGRHCIKAQHRAASPSQLAAVRKEDARAWSCPRASRGQECPTRAPNGTRGGPGTEGGGGRLKPAQGSKTDTRRASRASRS